MKWHSFTICITAALLGIALAGKVAQASSVTTTLSISVCGDGIVVTPPEFCDTMTNTGAYSTSIAGRNCTPGCLSYGIYCGDGVLQPFYGEECDDGNNISGDRCSDVCKIEDLASGCCPGRGPAPASGGSYSPGSATPPITSVPTKVAIFGKAYPDASVHILKDGVVVGVVKADPKADFYFATTDITPGIATFGFWAEDKQNIKSIAYTLTFRVSPNAVTTVTGAYLPPTIIADKRRVARGEALTFSGQSIPDAEVQTYVNSDAQIVQKTKSTSSGDWQMLFDSTPLEDENFHTAKSLFQMGTSTEALRSSFSELVTFYVGKGESVDVRTRSDTNHDGRINFVDFSILIYYWGTANLDADVNLDGKVNLVDFSLLIYYWTG